MESGSENFETNRKAKAIPEEKLDFSGLVVRLLSNFPPRTRDILRKRYGLDQEEGDTLEKIGLDYGITRERVRQIISDAVKNVRRQLNGFEFKKIQEFLELTINNNSGIIKENDPVFFSDCYGSIERSAIKFFAACSDKVIVLDEEGIIKASWAASPAIVAKAKKVIGEAEKILSKGKKTMSSGELTKKIRGVFPELLPEEIVNYLSVSAIVKKNKFDKWGIKNWAEINPKGTKERIYLVLKEKKQPLHFIKIAKLIDEYGLGKKKSHPQTVHNELIKDSRFVLIGRGIYALSEWGYSQGTIKDVLRSILEKSVRPMEREDILAEVLRIRRVKKATVMINLNNREVFEKQKNSYSIKNKPR